MRAPLGGSSRPPAGPPGTRSHSSSSPRYCSSQFYKNILLLYLRRSYLSSAKKVPVLFVNKKQFLVKKSFLTNYQIGPKVLKCLNSPF